MNKKGEYGCKYCGVKLGQSSDVSRHYNNNPECYNKWKKDKEDEYNNKTWVKCEICGDLLRNISNTHCKKHNITQQQYKEKFPLADIFADGLLNIQKENREKSTKEKYTEEEIKKFRSVRDRKLKSLSDEERKKVYEKEAKQKQEGYLKKYGKKTHPYTKEFYDDLRKDKTAWELHKQKSLKKRIETNIEKYGVDFAQKLDETKQKQKDTLIKNFGSLKNAYDVIIGKVIKSRLENYGTTHYCPMFSLVSQSLFREIDKELKDKFVIYYATNGEGKTNEFPVLIKDGMVKLRYLDFYALELNKCIEFDEDYHTTENQKICDEIREQEIKRSVEGIEILRIEKKDYENNPKETVKKCLEFLLGI